MLFSQTAQIVVPGDDNGGNGYRFNGCAVISVADSGGRSGNYGNNENSLATFCPDISTDQIQLDIQTLDLAAGDVLTIYDGDSTSAPVLFTGTAGDAAPGLLQATNATPTGCLTLTFTSNGSGTARGFFGRRSCFNPCQAISPTVVTNPPMDGDGIVRICQGDTVDFNGSAVFSDDASGAVYTFDLGNGNGEVVGPNQSETYSQPGVYYVQFTATDNQGCFDRVENDVIVQVSTDPDFTGTRAEESNLCFGESTNLIGQVATTDFTVDIAPPVAGTTFLPDGVGVSYRTCVTVDGFPNGAILTDASDIAGIFAVIEHSWTSDLDIEITSPSGQNIFLFARTGGGTFFGEPIDDDSNLNPGIGYRYNFTESGSATRTLGATANATGGGVSIPPGDYFPEDSFVGLVGSTLNGDWCITVTDFLPSDNGYIFEWGIEFAPGVLPPEISFQPSVASTRWLPDPTIEEINGETITVRPDVTGQTCYTYELIDSFGCEYFRTVCVNVEPEIPTGTPNNYTFCSNSTTTSIDLTQNDTALLAALDPATHTVSYYLTEENAFDQRNALTNADNYPVPSTTQIIYAAVFDQNAGCADVQPIEINIFDVGDIQVADLEVCEALVGYNLEDYIRTSAGLTGSSDISITIHDNQNDADTGASERSDLFIYDQASGTVEIFVRFESTVNTACAATDSFEISVTPSVTSRILDDLEQCQNPDGTPVSFDLEDQDVAVLNGSSPSDFTITYHDSLDDAMNDRDPLPFMDYEVSSIETIHVRIESQINPTCYTLNSFDVVPFELPDLATAPDLIEDDDLSGDNVEIFNLTDNEVAIAANLSSFNYSFTYHASRNAAEVGTPEIQNPTTYQNINLSDTIYVRVENTITGCYSITEFDVIVNPLPDLGVPIDLSECGDLTQAQTIFTLSENTSRIEDGRNDVLITYHDSFQNAEAGIDDLDDQSYPASSTPQTVFYRVQATNGTVFNVGQFDVITVGAPTANQPSDIEACADENGVATVNLSDPTLELNITGGQPDVTLTIYENQNDADNLTDALGASFEFSGDTTLIARVDDDNSECFSFTTISLIFNELPELTTAPAIELCDDLSEDGIEVFDLTQNNTLITQNVSAPNLAISYYSDRNAALNGTGTTLPDNYPNANPNQNEEIFVRVENTDTGCASVTSFEIRVISIPGLGNPQELVECDPSGNQEAVFALSENTDDIINGRNNIVVTYYQDRQDAEDGTDPLDESNHQNMGNPQEIFYQVRNTDTSCLNVGSFFIRTVDAPIAIIPMPLDDECDTGNGTATVDLTQVTGQVTNNTPGSTLSFYANQDDADLMVNALNATSYEFDRDQTIVIRVDADNTECASFTTVDLVFNELPAPILDDEYRLCVDVDGSLINGPVPLDTGLNNTDYTFEWSLSGNIIAGATSSIYNATEEGDYSVLVTDIMTQCQQSETTFVRERGVPEIYDIQVTTTPFDLTHNVIATAQGPDEYWFRLDDGPYIYTGLWEDVQPGPHTVTVAERSGCGEIVEEIFVFGYPDFFTPNDDGYHDTWNIVGGDLLPGTTLNIFDRYGKLIANIDPSGPGWDGTFNGEQLPSTDYWFVINYEVDGRTAEARGHFAMKR
ncbi:hypothetical protein BST97_06140 [Nonlabens spongiae]|uniref:P/Homo B domain-containing protein n=2 Tax=Nonlabens spongiae TaxID=331648 RepID=A0A1W6MJ17_9FLAO|nr:hypothetical protein BST97_06140 [Nonlabens spongiae]